MRKPTTEQAAFMDFKFGLGQLVTHKASGMVGVVTLRILVQAQTGNTSHMYGVASGDTYRRRFEIELEATEQK